MINSDGVGQYGFLIEVTAKRTKQTLQRLLVENGIDLTVDQWVVLDHVDTNDGINQFVLAEKVFKDQPTVTRIIDILCKKGLIKRELDEKDRRRFRLFMLEAGRKVVGEARPIVLEVRTLGWQGLSTTDYENLVRILGKINSNYQNQPEEVEHLN